MTKVDLVRQRPWLLSGVAALALVAGAPVALAQDSAPEEVEDDEDRVVVTGSLIARSDITSAAPVTIIDGAALERSGFLDLGEALRQQLATGSGGFNQSSTLSGGGATSIDLRNLGAARVLVLINGKRVANFSDSLSNESADLSFISASMVERVEILRDGASALYGADAVSGVVNVILKEDFEGVRLSGQQGLSTHGDAESTTLSATAGGNFDGGNFVFNLEYRFRDNVPQGQRDWAVPTITSLGTSGLFTGSYFSPGGVFSTPGQGTVFCGDFSGSGVNLIETLGVCPSFQSTTDPDDSLRYDYGPVQDIIVGQQVLNASGYLTYDVTDDLEGYVEFQVSKRESTRRLDGLPGTFGTPGIPQGWVVPATNPFNPFNEAGTFQIRPSNTIGRRDSEFTSDLIRTVVGLRGQDLFDLFDWEVAYLWTQVEGKNVNTNLWNLARANIISDPDLCAADTLCSAAVNPAGALNVLAPAEWTASEISYLRHDATGTSEFQTEVIYGFLSGEVFQLPAGKIGVAAGFEYREEEGANTPDRVISSGESVSNQVFGTEGRFDVWEVYGEVDIPLLSDLPFAEDLRINVQGRYFEYSNFGNDTVYKLGVNYAVTEDVRLRGSFGTAYRAPSISNLFGGGVASFDFVTDPCVNWDTANDPGSEVFQNCQLAGVAPGFQQPTGQYQAVAGGSPTLEPETAETLTIGVVFTPRFIEGLSITVDYYDIEVENLITRPTSDSIIDACYQGPIGLAAPECGRFTRDPNSGAVIGLVNQLSNSANALETSGYDWAVSYGMDLYGGFLTLSHEGTYVAEFSSSPGVGGASDRGSVPQFRGNASANYSRDDWSLSWRVRAVGELDDPRFDGNNILNYDKVDKHIEHDVYGEYRFENYSVGLGINNILDNEPPYLFSTSSNTDPFTYGSAVLGRYFFLRASADL